MGFEMFEVSSRLLQEWAFILVLDSQFVGRSPREKHKTPAFTLQITNHVNVAYTAPCLGRIFTVGA